MCVYFNKILLPFFSFFFIVRSIPLGNSSSIESGTSRLAKLEQGYNSRNTLEKATSYNIQCFFQGFFTLIINIEGKYLLFLVHFWHQTFIFLVPVQGYS